MPKIVCKGTKLQHPTMAKKKTPAPPATLNKRLHAVWKEIRPQLDEDTPEVLCEAICVQINTMREANQAVAQDGIVVKDPKENPIAHPALLIQRESQNQLAQLLKKWLKREPLGFNLNVTSNTR